MFAADLSSTSAPNAGIWASTAGFIPLLPICGVFYFLVIPPQQKKLEERNKLLESLKRGDKTGNNPLVYTCICFYEAVHILESLSSHVMACWPYIKCIHIVW
ncbi:preprotein translocase subunit YajC [Anaplasma phagocytophilum]|uniref:preprotein translocase subunit YajC n=1 Tax=Anaplasma phagocytophilum TaxID=948 RepID=UPI0009B82B7A|nr:preprotein translocase subunit YajC [Anaplasma phagocytophilum]